MVSTSLRKGFILVVAALVVLCAVPFLAQAATPELPDFEAAGFSDPADIDNRWISLPVGLELRYEGETDDGTEVRNITVADDTRSILDVAALVVREKVYLDGELVRDIHRYLAQDTQRNVWYLGAEVDNYDNGTITDNDG